MATSEEIKNALIGQLATFNGSSTEEQAMASENIGKIYVPTDEDVIIINKRRVGCGRNATTEKDGLMSVNDKKNLDYMTVHLDGIDTTLADIPNTYATKEEVEKDFVAVNNSLAIASSTATEALGKANEAKGKVDNIISGTTVVPTATNAQEAQKATQDGSGNEITKTYATKAELKTTNDSLGTTAATANDAKSKVDRIISGDTVVPSATNAQIAQTATNLANNPTLAKGTNNTNAITVKAGGKKSDEFVVPYATTADKASKDGSGKVISDTYATKEELNNKLNASDAMVLAGTISGTGVIQLHNDSVVTQNVNDGTTNISALTDYKAGWTWRVASNGTISGIGKVESGDMVMCISDYKSAYSASDWSAIQRNIDLATSNSAGLMSAQDKANLDGALTHLDGIDTKINSIEGDITNINKDLTTNYATKTEMGTVEDKADAAKSTANEAKGIANSLVNGTTKAKKAETADSATKATQDGNGKVINETYALRGEAVATQDLGKYVPVNKHTGGTLAFPLATQSAGGAMSSDDKKKLDDTEGTYYSSFNVTGSGWYRLVNVPVAKWLDKYLVVDIMNAAGSPARNSFKIYYNSPNGWVNEFSNTFICVPLTRTNAQCVDKARLVLKGGVSQYIDVYIIFPSGVRNLKVTIQSNIDSQYLAKNPVGADGKEGVAEAVTIALPEGYKSIERNAYVGYHTSDNPRRVVGGLFSERSLQDINGARIDEQYATKTEMNSYLPETLANGGYINTLQENSNAQFIPFLQNEFAHLIERGGSVSVAINGTEFTRGGDTEEEATKRKLFFDGCNSYYDIMSSYMGLQDTVAITITSPATYSYSGTIYCLMPNGWRGKNVKFELFYPSLNNGAGEWHTMYEGTNLGKGLVYQPIKTLYDANGNILVPTNTKWNKLRVTITNFIATDIRLRIAEIGYVAYASKNSSAICLPRNGGEIYGGITPLNDNAYDLGASGKAWKNVYGKQLTSTAAEGTAPLVVSSKTMVSNLNAEMWYGFKYQRRSPHDNKPYAKVVTIRIKGLNINSPITFSLVGRRDSTKSTISVRFNNSTIDAYTISSFKYYGDGRHASKLRLCKAGIETDDKGVVTASVFEIWSTEQAESFDSVATFDFHWNADNVHITQEDLPADALPDYATVEGGDTAGLWKDCTVANMDVIASSSKMLMGSSNAPLNVGHGGKPVYFNGGIPVACNISESGNRWGVLTPVSNEGVMDIGKYIDFHCSDTSDKDYDVRITSRDANDVDGAGLTLGGNTIASGKFGQHSGFIGSDTSGLSSYWAKLWELDDYKSLGNDIDLTMYLHSAFDNFSGIVHIRVRWGRLQKEDGTYTVGNHAVYVRQVVGNVPIDRVRLYYKYDIDASTGAITNGQIEIWGNVDHQYGVINAVLLSLTQRVGVEKTDYYGTFNQTTFTTVQTPTLPNYVEMTNVIINQTAAKAQAADKAYNADNATNANFAGIVKSVAVPATENNILQHVSGHIDVGDEAGNAKKGSNADSNLWSYPEGGIYVNSETNKASIQTIRLKWDNIYFHDILMSPTHAGLWHRQVNNSNAQPWMKIVEATEDGKVIIEGTTQEDTLRIKNKDRSTGEIHIFNGEQGNAVIRHYEGSTPTDLKFNSTQVMHGSKILAYANDVTALQTEITNLKKTVQEQATLIEALQSALTWE